MAQVYDVVVTAEIALGKRIFRDQLLFTHRGFSGPLALNTSLFVNGATEITVNFLPDCDVAALIQASRSGKKSLAGILSEHLPKAVVRVLLAD